MYVELLEGAYDLHVHTGPDVMNRKLDDLDMAERIQKVGMKGWGIKSHYFCTAERAKLVKKVYPNVNPIGAIALNNSVGGLNPMAVEMAARDGVKIVWMPTFDSTNEQEFFKKGSHKKLPFWAKLQMELIEQGKVQASISILEDSKLKKEVYDVLDVIAQHNLILATGHLGKEETFAIVKAAVDLKVKKIVITHPNFPSIDFTKEEQKELAQLGAYMEHCFTTPHSGKITWEAVYEQIRYVGPQSCILSTDLGQPNNPYPDEGLLEFATNLIKNGFTKDEIKQMTVKNTGFLVEE
jgi:stage V sporulation protein SpoVS